MTLPVPNSGTPLGNDSQSQDAILEAIARLRRIPGFPPADDVRGTGDVIDVVLSMVMMVEHLEWLVASAISAMRRWNLAHFRGIYCARWRPKDGLECDAPEDFVIVIERGTEYAAPLAGRTKEPPLTDAEREWISQYKARRAEQLSKQATVYLGNTRLTQRQENDLRFRSVRITLMELGLTEDAITRVVDKIHSELAEAGKEHHV